MITLLRGYRVVEFAPFLPGPLCGWSLAGLGAEVVKIEPPEGDPMRWFRPRLGDGSSARFHLANGGKHSESLDLKTPEGQRRALELCSGADAFIDGYRPGVADRLGLGFEAVRSVAPYVVYCSITGYGQTGPRRSQPGHDLNYASLAGVIATTGVEDGPPIRPSVPLGDDLAALTAALVIASGLAERPRRARRIDVSIAECLLSALSPRLDRILAGTGVPRRGSFSSGSNDVYACSDGRWLSVGAVESHFWRRFCLALGLDDLADDPGLADDDDRIERRAEFRDRIEAAFRARPRDEWVALLEAQDVPCTPVLEAEEALEEGHFRARDMVQPLQQGSAPWTLRFPALVDGKASDPRPAPAWEAKTAAPPLATSPRRRKEKNDGSVSRQGVRAHPLRGEERRGSGDDKPAEGTQLLHPPNPAGTDRGVP